MRCIFAFVVVVVVVVTSLAVSCDVILVAVIYMKIRTISLEILAHYNDL